MSVYFLDSSALAKRYIAETGSGWVAGLCDPLAGDVIIVARMTWVEVLSALARRQREGGLSAELVQRTVRSFRQDFDAEYQVVEFEARVAQAAGDLLLRYPLRAYDAVQLASALQIQPSLWRTASSSLTFLSADERLLTVAAAEGLQVDNPLQHP